MVELKYSRNWGNKSPLKWIAFGEREELPPVDPAEHDPTYRFQPEWRDAEPAAVKELQGAFTIVSGKTHLVFLAEGSVLIMNLRRASLGSTYFNLEWTHDKRS